MKNINVLIVENEDTVINVLRNHIDGWGYTVLDSCTDREKILSLIESKDINVLFMDISIEGCKRGLETAEIIKKKYPKIEIIFLCDQLDEYDISRAIKIDPIAYLAKPINREEQHLYLMIAMHRILNENKREKTDPTHLILDKEFSYDMSSSILFYDNEPMHLTKKESALLNLLVEHKNTIVDTSTIKNIIWTEVEINDNAIRSLIKRLRQKLKHKFIQTFATQGYMLSLKNYI